MRTAALVVALSVTVGIVPARAADDPSVRGPMDEAIDRALAFLKSTQQADGGWGQGTDIARIRFARGNNPAITSLCVMAFLSAGHVPSEGKYGEVVEKGIRSVMRAQQANGVITTDGQGQFEMYHHGICTLMLAEVVGMTDGKLATEVRQRLEKAINVILRAQRPSGTGKGGWRYRVESSDADISVTGWQLMALRAAKNLGCDVPPEAIERAVEFIKRCHDPSSGGFRYLPGAGVTIPCTGTSILGLEICGKNLHRAPESLRGGSYILKNPLRYNQTHFFYGVYYTSQAMFQLGGNYWEAFRPTLHELLLRNQSPSGAWFGRGSDDQHFGPNYCSAMAVLALTVEYRYLPIYQRGEEPSTSSD